MVTEMMGCGHAVLRFENFDLTNGEKWAEMG